MTERSPATAVSRHARQSRSAVLWALAGFLFFQLALSIGIDHWWIELRDPEYGNRLVRLQAQQAKATDCSLMLVLGTSQTSNGFRADLSDHQRADSSSPLVFNFGITGSGPERELVYLRQLLRRGCRPRWLLIEVVPVLLLRQGDLRVKVERYDWQDLYTLRNYCSQPLSQRCHWLQARLAAWFSYRFALTSRLAPSWVPPNCDYCQEKIWWAGMDRAGWVAYPNPSSDDKRHVWIEDNHRRCQPLIDSARLNRTHVRALRDLLETCRGQSIITALFVMPQSSSFRTWYSPKAIASVDLCVAQLRAEFQVPLVDCRDWVGDEGFYDALHMLPQGAAIFSERFQREAIQPLAEGKLGYRPSIPVNCLEERP